MPAPELTGRFLILLGDGNSPEEFGFPCGANVRQVRLINNLGEDVVLDCDSPLDVPATITRYLQSQDTQATISGRCAKSHLPVWREFADDGVPKNIRIQLDESLQNGGGYWTLPCYMSDFELGAEGNSTATFSASLMGAGQRVWTDAPTGT